MATRMRTTARRFFCTASLACMSAAAFADRYGLNESMSETAGDGSFGGPTVLVVALGALIGYFAERSFNKHKLDKEGARYSSDYLGGKVGAVVGAVALPVLIGLLR